MTTSGTVDVVVVRGKTVLARRRTTFIDDAPSATAGDDTGDADLTLTLAVDDAAEVREHRLDLSVAFMRGQMKTAGDPGLLLRLLPLVSAAGAPVEPSVLVPEV